MNKYVVTVPGGAKPEVEGHSMAVSPTGALIFGDVLGGDLCHAIAPGKWDSAEKVRKPCPATGEPCAHFAFLRSDDGEVAITFCRHDGNADKAEGNCSKELCPVLTAPGGKES